MCVCVRESVYVCVHACVRVCLCVYRQRGVFMIPSIHSVEQQYFTVCVYVCVCVVCVRVSVFVCVCKVLMQIIRRASDRGANKTRI